MRRPLVACGALVFVALPASPQQKPGAVGSRANVQHCRTVVTAATTRSTGPGFSADTTTTCSYDKETNKSTCTNRYKDTFGNSSTTVSVTTFSSLADLIDEVKVVPPLRRSRRTDTTAKSLQGSKISSLVNTYDRHKRLVREVGASASGAQYTTTYTAWDASGRPTAGTSVHPGGTTTLALVYNDATFTLTTTSGSGGQRVICHQTFDANGNPASTSCSGTGGSKDGSTSTTTATERICR